jgi:prevent-host-death family protein
MKDHSVASRARRRPARETIGVRELKTHAARIVRRVRDAQASYILTHRGRAVGLILPLDAAGRVPDELEEADAAAAWDAFLRAGHRLEDGFRPGLSGVRALSDTRR